MKRFYKNVAVKAVGKSWQVTLDDRAIKTVKGANQTLPTKPLAQQLALEWSEQGEEIDTNAFIFRDMADYAIDIIAKDRKPVISKLLSYAETDTLCYRADPEDALFARQQEMWEPLLASIEQAHNITLTRISGIVHQPQSEAAMARFQAQLEQCDAFTLAGLENLASLSSSLIIALLAIEDRADPQAQWPDALWNAANLEEDWQAELWGSDEEAEQRRSLRRDAFMQAHQFIALAQRG